MATYVKCQQTLAKFGVEAIEIFPGPSDEGCSRTFGEGCDFDIEDFEKSLKKAGVSAKKICRSDDFYGWNAEIVGYELSYNGRKTSLVRSKRSGGMGGTSITYEIVFSLPPDRLCTDEFMESTKNEFEASRKERSNRKESTNNSLMNDDVSWYGFNFYKPESRECELLKEVLVKVPKGIYEAIPDNLTPGKFADVIEMVFRDFISTTGVIVGDNGVPFTVYGRTKDDLPGQEPSILFVVSKGHEKCEKDRFVAVQKRIEIIQRDR